MLFQPNATRTHHGFTLVELLVVIMIIGILIGLLLVALSRARDSAQAAECGSQLRQVGHALGLYAADSADWTPDMPPINCVTFPFTVYKSAGADIWGAHQLPFSGAPTVNGPLGLGMLVKRAAYDDSGNLTCLGDSSYLGTLDCLWCPTQKTVMIDDATGYPSYWARRKYFGDPYNAAWNSDGQPWNTGGANYRLTCSYGYTSSDWEVYTASSNALQWSKEFTNIPTQKTQTNARTLFRKLRTYENEYPQRAITMDQRGSYHQSLGGGNVQMGDGSVHFWTDSKYASDYYTSTVANGTGKPSNPLSAAKNHNDVLGWLFAMASVQGHK